MAGRRKEFSLSQKEVVALIKNRDSKPYRCPIRVTWKMAAANRLEFLLDHV
jgi:hypothetical protein